MMMMMSSFRCGLRALCATVVAAMAFLGAGSADHASAEAEMIMRPDGAWFDIQGLRPRGGIFVPPPKDADDKLDNSDAAGDGNNTDVVRGLDGTILKGKVKRITAEGTLLLSGPQFIQDVTMRRSALDRVELQCSFKESATDMVVLTNGDKVAGQLATINDEMLVIHSDVAGPIKIQNKLVASVQFGRDTTSLLDSDFSDGNMAPWKIRSGSWSVSNGELVCTSSSSQDAVYAELDQKEAVTFVVKFKSTGGSRAKIALVLFADTTDNYYGRNSVYGYVYSTEYYIGCARGGGTSTLVSRSIGRTIQEGTLRFAYDPKTSKAHLWLDSTDLGEISVPNKPTTGKYVILSSRYTARISRIQVLRGIVPPSGMENDGDEKVHIVNFENGDRVSVVAFSMADGTLSMTTSFCELASPIEKIGSIVFRKEDREEPRRTKGDVRVRTSRSRFTIQLDEMTDEHLIGSSPCYGRVKLRRDAVRSIKFNVYK